MQVDGGRARWGIGALFPGFACGSTPGYQAAVHTEVARLERSERRGPSLQSRLRSHPQDIPHGQARRLALDALGAARGERRNHALPRLAPHPARPRFRRLPRPLRVVGRRRSRFLGQRVGLLRDQILRALQHRAGRCPDAGREVVSEREAELRRTHPTSGPAGRSRGVGRERAITPRAADVGNAGGGRYALCRPAARSRRHGGG